MFSSVSHLTNSTILIDSPHVEILGAMEPIVDQWWELFWNSPDATPFQSPAWLLPWWSVFGKGEPLVVAVRHGNQLSGLGLFYIYDGDTALGRQLFFIGKAVSDYQDILIARGESRRAVAQQILDSALKRGEQCYSADFDRLRPASALLELQLPPGVRKSQFQEGVCPRIAISGSRTEGVVLKSSTRRNIRNAYRRACKLGQVEFITAGERDHNLFMDALLRLHSRRWNSAGMPGVFSNDHMSRFLRSAASELLSSGMLRLYAMRVGGVIVAVSLALLHQGSVYLYASGFHPDYSAIAPGTQLLAFAMEQAAREGASIADFLQGDEAFKFQQWGAEPRYTYRVRYFLRNARNEGQ